MKKKVCIIGAGLGGLSTALRLSTQGYEVSIIEKYHQAGGRLNQIKKDGFTFDLGPSFFSMSYEFDELFKSCNVKNPLQFNELNPLYGVYFSHKKDPYLIYKDLPRLAKEFEKLEPNLEPKIRKYLSQAKGLFHDTEYRIVKRNYPSKMAYLLALMSVPLRHAPKLGRSMWTELGRYFTTHEVKVIFSLVAFFLGATPFDTPAVYSLLNYTELEHDGYWNVQGGMYRITQAMLKLLQERHVNIAYNTEVHDFEFDKGKIVAFIDQNQQKHTADIFVVNADAAAFRGQVLKRSKYTEPKLDRLEWTLSPFTIYLGVQGKLDNLYHHTYFLGDNFEEYANKIFKTSVSPQKPYYYVNMSSKSNPEAAPEGCENLFILCPMPDLRYKSDWSDSEQLADTIIQDLGHRIGYDLHKNTLTREIWNPIKWRDHFNLYKGSGLGLAHGLNQVGGLRPSNKDEQFNNVYYVGASTVPGTGLPIVVISSRLVTELVLKEHTV